MRILFFFSSIYTLTNCAYFEQAFNSSSSVSNNDTNSKIISDEQSSKDEGLLDELLVTTKPDAVVSTETADEAEIDEVGGSDEVVTKIDIDSVAHEEEEMETVTVIFYYFVLQNLFTNTL